LTDIILSANEFINIINGPQYDKSDDIFLIDRSYPPSIKKDIEKEIENICSVLGKDIKWIKEIYIVNKDEYPIDRLKGTEGLKAIRENPSIIINAQLGAFSFDSEKIAIFYSNIVLSDPRAFRKKTFHFTVFHEIKHLLDKVKYGKAKDYFIKNQPEANKSADDYAACMVKKLK
jgi:hypothetical protein